MALMLSQDAEELTLVSREGDPISFAFSAKDVNWDAEYVMQVRKKAEAASPVLLTVTVVATFNTPNTDFQLTAHKEDNTVPVGKYVWDMEEVDGPTRLGGEWIVTGQVTRV